MNTLDIHYNGRLEDEPTGHDGPAKAGHYVRIACAALLGGVVYLNALHNPFVYDDHHTVVQNPSIASVTDVRAVVLGAVTRPIVNFSYALDRAVWGAGPFGFHVTNVLLHMLNVVLLFQLARRFEKGRPLVAFAAAMLLAVHPMMTEAVGYISGRSEVLCATFFMLAIMSGRRWLESRSKDLRYEWASTDGWRSGSRRWPPKKPRRCFRSSSLPMTGWVCREARPPDAGVS